MPSIDDKVIQKEINDILRAEIIKPAHVPETFRIIIAIESEVRPRFRTDHRALHKRMKTKKFPITDVEEVTDLA